MRGRPKNKIIDETTGFLVCSPAKPTARGAALRFLRKHLDLRQEQFARLLRVNKTTLSKWENNEDPIGLQSDLLARAIVISRNKRLEKRAAYHFRAFEKIPNQQNRVRVEVDAEKLEYEYA